MAAEDRREVVTRSKPRAGVLSRRALLQAAAGGALATTVAAPLGDRARAAGSPARAAVPPGRVSSQNPEALFRWLDARIEAAMAQYEVPGVALGVSFQGQEYVRGYGVTNVDYPQPVDGDTLFRLGSMTKSYTGAAIMRLVEQGRVSLDAPVRTYLPRFQVSDESVAARVTLRQALNHSAGWLGDFYGDFGRGADALERYVAGMAMLPQLTPPGQVWHYNNAGFVLAGHVLETMHGQPYEDAVQELVLAPLGLDHTFFYSDAVIGYNVAASHTMDGGRPRVQPAYWGMARTLHPTGGLISSVRDQLRYARFHLGEVGATGGQAVLSPTSIRAMRADLTPPGTMGVELDGIGVAWWMRSSPERVPICQIGGDWPGQHAGMLVVPDRAFALVVLTNGDGGEAVVVEVCAFDDGVLPQFLGLNNPPSVPRMLTAAELAPYEGRYLAMAINPPPGDVPETWVEISGSEGKLRATRIEGDKRQEFDLAFYRDNYAVLLDPQGQPSASRADFGPGPDGRSVWFRLGGRLHMRQG